MRASGTEGDKGVSVCLLGWAVSNGQIRVSPYRLTYSIFTKLIKKQILCGHVSIAYRPRIRIGYVSNTGYGTSLAYPCYVEKRHQSF